MKRGQYLLDFIFTSRLKNYTNIYVCTPLHPSYLQNSENYPGLRLFCNTAAIRQDRVIKGSYLLRHEKTQESYTHFLQRIEGLKDYLKLYPSWVRQIKSLNKSQEWGRCDIKGVQVFTYSSKFQTPKRDCYMLASEFYCPYPPTLRVSLLFSRTRKEGEAVESL